VQYSSTEIARLSLRTLNGQVAVITGGGSGIGAAVAIALAQQGAAINLIGRRLKALEDVAAKARSMGSQAHCYSADLSSPSEQHEIAHRLNAELTHLDILVQNAAMFSKSSVEHASISQFDRLYQINLRAPYLLTQVLLPKLKARRGQIVFINSSSGVTAKPMSAQYDATKHALKAVADSLRAEVNEHGVRVLSMYLGRTATEMQKQICQLDQVPFRPEQLLQPEDVSGVIANAIALPRTAEVTDIWVRPMIKP
jgi:NADP-dependent 3-hydroxy acid dehydrogenase YdfG